MSVVSNKMDTRALVTQLRENPAAIGWQRRLEAAEFALEELQGDSAAAVLPLVTVLSNDPKWEVRQKIAELLQFLPKDLLNALGPTLEADRNAYVARTAAEARRKRDVVEGRLATQHAVDGLQGRYAEVARLHGKTALREIDIISQTKTRRRVESFIHDLLNLLANMSATGRIAEQLQREGHPLAADAAKAHRAKQVIETYLQELRNTSRSVGKARRRCSVRSLVVHADKLARHALTNQGLDLSAVASKIAVPANLKVEANEQALLLVLVNVIKNAYESFWTGSEMLKPGNIKMAAESVDRYVSITVADTGRGMDAHDLSCVRAFLGGSRSSTKPCSTGLGLPSAHEIVSAHGGELSIESVLGTGTSVMVLLPAGGQK